MGFPRSRALSTKTKKVLGKPGQFGHSSDLILASRYWPLASFKRNRRLKSVQDVLLLHQTPIHPSKPSAEGPFLYKAEYSRKRWGSEAIPSVQILGPWKDRSSHYSGRARWGTGSQDWNHTVLVPTLTPPLTRRVNLSTFLNLSEPSNWGK